MVWNGLICCWSSPQVDLQYALFKKIALYLLENIWNIYKLMPCCKKTQQWGQQTSCPFQSATFDQYTTSQGAFSSSFCHAIREHGPAEEACFILAACRRGLHRSPTLTFLYLPSGLPMTRSWMPSSTQCLEGIEVYSITLQICLFIHVPHSFRQFGCRNILRLEMIL